MDSEALGKLRFLMKIWTAVDKAIAEIAIVSQPRRDLYQPRSNAPAIVAPELQPASVPASPRDHTKPPSR
jgi:hypothetical protein